MKDVLETLPSRSISNYIKISQRQRSRKTGQGTQQNGMDKIALRKVPPVLYL